MEILTEEEITVVPDEQGIELSVVMPCLNEADTVEICIAKALRAMEEHQIAGEIIVADNGSTDASQDLAAAAGARVVNVSDKGYGAALMGGIAQARGRYIIMGDADDSYDFGEIPNILAGLRQGNSLVQGCRLPAGGGRIMPGAMPRLHRYWGNPMFSAMAKRWFSAPITDVYCGLRGFSRELYERLDMRCLGMEFATEMIIKASLNGESIAEVPITLHPDGRKAHAPHLRTFRDGWRTLRFFLLYSPRWLFMIPGLLLMALGFLGFGLALPGVEVLGSQLDAHTLLFSSVAVLCGYQAALFAVLSKIYAVNEGLLPSDDRYERFFRHVNLERGLLLGSLTFLVGVALLLVVVEIWRRTGFGELNYADTMRWAVPGATLTALGFQTVISSFYASLLGLNRR